MRTLEEITLELDEKYRYAMKKWPDFMEIREFNRELNKLIHEEYRLELLKQEQKNTP